ncbi:PREDICTED: cytosolic carboxypeptidase 6 isoform X2 [Bactrocera latifrons]|uniref:cytosolic carboxypeptidase 6 isoform X2 n=1 Tax=Bactrocera latifrons TaxID=174628 RepID=UPI0008DD10E7|nr:PREDICTED: cytosolic carboxypeptidase 6 isoform X2 [Bactrocera latifrons]
MMFGMACDPLKHTSMYERMNEDSEDSDGEGGLGNVSRVIIRPPGQSGKAKRGHLCFDAAFETGNLGKAELIGDFEYDLFLRPDTCNPRFRFWFNFTVDNVRQDQRVLFNIVNISNPRNLFNSSLVPLVKSSSRPKWQRLPKKNVFYYRSLLHQNHYVLSFAFSFDKEDDVYQFAVAPPYSYSRLQSYLNVIDARQTEQRFVRSVLTKSVQKRNLDLLTIDHVTAKTKASRLDRGFIRIIVILCRVHPGDAPASFMCQGFIEFITSNHPIAVVLRDNFVFKIVPMVNPDGVFLGNNRCNLIGQDLNRTWHVATEFSHPTLYAVRNMLKELDNSDIYQIDFVIDLHANPSLHGCFIYGNTYEDVYRHERHLVFPRLFAANAPDYVAENTMYNADEKKVGCARRYFCERLSDTVNAYTVEVSMSGHYLKDGKTVALYNEDGYYRCGRNLARTFLHYYRFINVLPTPVVSEARLRRRNRPRTHHSRSRSRTRYEVKPRPKTTRCYAPIAYTNLSIHYDSGGGSSDEGGFSPTRPIAPGSSLFSGYRNYRRMHGSSAVTHDQYALLALKSTKYDHLGDFGGAGRAHAYQPARAATAEKSGKSVTFEQPLNVPPKPYLSIIDLNQLTRGSLDRKSGSFDVDHR